MVIKGIRTKKHQTVTPELWAQMKEKGLARNFTVVNAVEPPAKAGAREDTKKSDYPALMETARRAEGEGDYAAALEAANAAFAIKPGNRLTARIKRLTELVGTTFSEETDPLS